MSHEIDNHLIMKLNKKPILGIWGDRSKWHDTYSQRADSIVGEVRIGIDGTKTWLVVQNGTCLKGNSELPDRKERAKGGQRKVVYRAHGPCRRKLCYS